MPSIEDMLAAMESQQIRCEKCGEHQHVMYVAPNYLTFDVTEMMIDGSILHGDSDDYCYPPESLTGPDLLCCNNADGHDDEKAHWWPVPPDTKINYGYVT